MTDKEKLDKLVAEIERVYHQSLFDENRQAEWGLSSAACTSYGKSKVCKELLSLINSMQKEPKECMYSKDNYTDEDRKVLCESCEEECEYSKKGKPVSEDLEKEIDEYISILTERRGDFPKLTKLRFRTIAHHFANWQKQQDNNDANHALVEQIKTQQMCYEKGMADMKQQMMAKAVDGFVIEDIEEGNGNFLLSAEYLSKDMGLKDRQKVKVIVIKEGDV